MTISSQTRKAGPFTGNGVTTAFPFAFKVFSSGDLLVVRATAAGAETTLTLGTDYSVTLNADQNSNPGGTVTLISPLASGLLLTMTSQVPLTQATDLTNQGGFYPQVITTSLDKLTILAQQLQEQADRSVKVQLSSSVTGDELRDDLLQARIDSQNSAQAAANSATASANSATSAGASATSASASAAAAALSAASGLYSAVQDKSADYTIVAADAGDLFRVTTTAATITMTLPVISSLGVGDGFKVAIAKFSSDTNVVLVVPQGGATINGTATYTLDYQYQSVSFIADLETNQWFAIGNGSQTANVAVDVFSGTGSQTAFTLSVSPTTVNATLVHISGVYQPKSRYTISGNTLTFSTAPPQGSSNIEVVTTQPVPIGTPSDNTVSTSKLQDSAVTTAKIANNAVDGTKINISGNLSGDLMFYNGTDWVRLTRSSITGTVLRYLAVNTPQWTESLALYANFGEVYDSFSVRAVPSWAKFCRAVIIGAGGGGSGGGKQTATATAVSGGGGGGSGAVVVVEFRCTGVSSINVNAGAAGAGGTGASVNGAGSAGTAGNPSSISFVDTYGNNCTLTASGGGGGSGATAGAAGALISGIANTPGLIVNVAGLAGGAGASGTGGAGATATAGLQLPGGGAGGGFTTNATVTAGGSSSTVYPGFGRTLVQTSSAASDGQWGFDAYAISQGLYGIDTALGATGGHSSSTATGGNGGNAFSNNSPLVYAYGCGGGGGGATRGSAFSGGNGGNGGGGAVYLYFW